MSIIHQNLQSIGNSVDKLVKLLKDSPECLFLCVTEHWLSTSQIELVGIPNFKLAASFCRNEGQHGGAAIYVRQDVQYTVFENVAVQSVMGVCEFIAVECQIRSQKVIVCSVYRPSGKPTDIFFDKLEEVCEIICNSRKLLLIAGDFNIDLLGTDRSAIDLISLMTSYGLQQTVFEYTRKKKHSSCIDNIFTSCEVSKAYVFEEHISDHTGQKVVFKIARGETSFVYRRFFKEESKKDFSINLQNQNWESILDMPKSDVNAQWNAFVNTFLNLFNESFPVTRVHKYGKKKHHHYSGKVDLLKKKLDDLLFLSTLDDKYKPLYKEAKREYDITLRSERVKEYDDRVNNSDNKIKCMWTICHEVTGKKHKNTECQMKGDVNTIADDYNQYLLNTIPNLINNLQHVPYQCNIDENNQSLYLKPITSEELEELGRQLKNKYSSGQDGIPTSIVKTCLKDIRSILCYIINNSLKFGIFPDQLKLVMIKPLFKKGDPSKMENYRPISLLQSFSKIFEIVMSSRLLEFMKHCKILNPNQHGYLRGKSTITAIYRFTQSIMEQLENRKLALGMFVDLSKAYDSLDVNILLQKLLRYGIRGPAYKWLGSYLSCRRQFVTIEMGVSQLKSKINQTSTGVPQGSILGPLLFITYVNDLDIPDFLITKYADDTNLLVWGDNLQSTLQEANEQFDNVTMWFARNKLILNPDKTTAILFKTKQSRVVIPETIVLGNAAHNLNGSCKFLGVYLDEFLDWGVHINNLCLKLSSTAYALRSVSLYMGDGGMRVFYFAAFESLARYGVTFWGANSDIEKVFVLQKKVVRSMFRMKYRESCRGVFRKNNMLTIYALYIFECLMFLFKHNEDFLSEYQHDYNTRTVNIQYPAHRLSLTEKGTYYRCIKFYNSLPTHLQELKTQNSFKNQIKKYLIGLELYTLADFPLREGI